MIADSRLMMQNLREVIVGSKLLGKEFLISMACSLALPLWGLLQNLHPVLSGACLVFWNLQKCTLTLPDTDKRLRSHCLCFRMQVLLGTVLTKECREENISPLWSMIFFGTWKIVLKTFKLLLQSVITLLLYSFPRMLQEQPHRR